MVCNVKFTIAHHLLLLITSNSHWIHVLIPSFLIVGPCGSWAPWIAPLKHVWAGTVSFWIVCIRSKYRNCVSSIVNDYCIYKCGRAHRYGTLHNVLPFYLAISCGVATIWSWISQPACILCHRKGCMNSEGTACMVLASRETYIGPCCSLVQDGTRNPPKCWY